jgi:MSHA biogenesis protein MshO
MSLGGLWLQRRPRGMTLIELIVVIMLTGIVASMAAVFVLRPVQGYVDLGRRAALVDAAESALRRMTRDIRLAAPNSVRATNVGSGFALELLPVVDGARYSTGEPPPNDDCKNLTGFDPSPADAEFDILGTFSTLPTGTPAGLRLVINNQGEGTGHDVYADGITPSPAAPLVITPVGTTITIVLNPVGTCPANGKHHITLSAAHQFRASSPRDRVFVVATPVSYVCDPGAGTLVRYAGYPIQASQPTTAAALNALAGVTSARVADNLELCTATTTTTQIRDRGLVTLTLTLHDQGERIRLVQQAQLDNSR